MNKDKRGLAIFVLLMLLAVGLGFKSGLFKASTWQPFFPHEEKIEALQTQKPEVMPLVPKVQPTPTPTPVPKPVVPAKMKIAPKEKVVPKPVQLAPATPPPVTLHKELIPKDIEIVRVYYEQQLTGPGSIIEFDINGTGFNAEFEKMITVESGSPNVSIKNLKLMTPNQIHGVLVIKSDAPTGAVFPQVLIQGKIVFRASDPFAVIRPGEVLNMIFIEMGENGRSGRFRVFTNLTQDMYSVFSVKVNTGPITVSDLVPNLPFIVDGVLNIGGAPGGAYGISISLGGKIIWNRDGIIQVVQPNVGQSGLAQQIRTNDAFHRPGDKAQFLLYGSGFQPQDVNLLRVKVDPFTTLQSTMVFKSPGRMELTIVVPLEAAPGFYKLAVLQGDKVLLEQDKAFVVVESNWTRDLKTEPALKPGGKGTLILTGRDLYKSFIDSIQIEVDSEDLKVGKFAWVGPEKAIAEVNTNPGIRPGDYLIQMTSNGAPVQPQFGSIIKINP